MTRLRIMLAGLLLLALSAAQAQQAPTSYVRQSGSWTFGLTGAVPAGTNTIGKVGIQVGGSDVSATNPVPVQPVDGFQPGGTTGYSATSAAVLFTQDMQGYPSISVQITSAGSGNTITYEVSNDYVTWLTKAGTFSNNTGTSTDITTDTATVLREFVTAARYFRARVSVYSSGTVTAVPTLRTAMPSGRSIYISGAVPFTSQLSASAATGGIATTSRLASSAATTNCTLVKASAGRNFKFAGFNTTASAKFIKFYNASTVPTAGGGTVIYNRALPPGAFSYDWADIGYYHSTGIGYCITGAAADADTTALAAGDIVAFNVDYQ